MISRRWKLHVAAAMVFAVSASPGSAQLFIDAAGPRNLLHPESKLQPKGDNLDLKFDTEKGGATLGYLRSLTGDADVQTIGLLASSHSADGGKSILRPAEFEATILWNRTSTDGVDSNSAWFLNLSCGYHDALLRHRLSAADPVSEKEFQTGFATIGIGRTFGARTGLALSCSYRRSNNYEELVEIEDDGKPAREGELVESNAVPVTLALTHEIDAPLLSPLLEKLVAGFTASDDSKYDEAYTVIAAIYATYDGITDGAVNHVLGLNLTAKRILIPKGDELTARRAVAKKIPGLGPNDLDGVSGASFADISLPLSVFVEWRQPFGNKPGETKVGAAVVFTWP